MGVTLKRIGWTAAAGLTLAVLVFAVRSHRSAKWRVQRDSIQAEAETAEHSGHPWAGVYLASNDYKIGGTLCLTPEGAYYGALYKGLGKRLGQGSGRASTENGRLTLTPSGLDGVDASGRLAGAYRIVHWGDIRCLVRPERTARFVHCMTRRDECGEFRPLCTRGYVYGEPDLDEELVRARREDPMLRPITVRSVSGPRPREWGWSWRVELSAGRDEGLKKGERFYWDGSEEWINVREVGPRTAIGDIQQGTKEGPRMKVPLRAGMKVTRWKPLIYLAPDFIRPMGKLKRH